MEMVTDGDSNLLFTYYTIAKVYRLVYKEGGIMEGNSLIVGWPDIRDYGFKDWEDYEQYLAELEEEDDEE